MVNVISQSELERIRNSLKEEQINIDQQSKKNKLKNLSNERVKHWPNTLEAMRKKKETFLKDKLEQEELVRQEIDKQEAEHRKKERLETIKRANDLLYEQRDKMKVLRSKLMLSDILYDRDKQVEENKILKLNEIEIKKKDHEDIINNVNRLQLIENDKILKQKQLVESIAKTRQDQLIDIKKRKDIEKEEERKIGVAIKEENKKRLQEEYELQQERLLQIKRNNDEFIKSNEILKELNNELKIKERNDNILRDKELDIIENRKNILKELEIKKFNKAQETRQKLIDATIEKLKLKINNDNERLNKQIEEITIKENNIIIKKQLKHNENIRLINNTRNEQIDNKIKLNEEYRVQEEKLIELWNKNNKIEIEKEKQLNKQRYQTVKQLKQNQLQESIQHKQNKINSKLINIENDKLLYSLHNNEDEKFINLCKEKIIEYNNQGKPIYPIIKALETTEIVLLPAKTVKVNSAK